MQVRIEKSFESRFLIKFISSVIASFFIVLLSLYLTIPRSEVLYYYEAVSSFIKTSDSLVKAFIIAGVIELIFIVFVIHIISILASHKLAGPLYRMEKALEGVAEGDLTRPVRFRHYDPFKDVANHFNAAVEEFAKKLRAIDKANDRLNTAMEKLDGTAKSIEKFKQEISALESEIEKFKL